MNKYIYLSLAAAAMLNAAEVTMDAIDVKSTTIKDVSGEEIKSADVAEALANKVPSIQLIRRSGIANDIILRGMKKDNINVLVDGTKVCGACPNRMDPPTSHVLTNNIESIEVVEGPYDVEHFGALAGGVYVTTVQPTKEFSGEINLNAGRWNYQKISAQASGGTDTFRVLLSASKEKSDQYEDGDGNDFAEQIDNFAGTTASLQGVKFQDQYRDMEAYDKQTFMGKVYIDITDDQELQLGYTANRSDDILYPTSKMDAIYDDSNIYDLQYSLKNLGSLSKEIKVQAYRSDVAHPMSTKYRKASLNDPKNPGNPNEVTSYLETEMTGLKIQNSLDVDDNTELTVGVDTSLRNWDGEYIKNGVVMKYPPTSPTPGKIKKSIDDVDTKNIALFLEAEQHLGKADVQVGARYDDTSVTPSSVHPENDYSALNGFIFTTYNTSDTLKVFGGLGASSRVPDGRELYFTASNAPSNQATVGTTNLKQTKNYQADLGVENNYDNFTLKTSVFYSVLKDYIYYNADKSLSRFENIDATRYGLEITGSYYATDALWLDFGLACQRGKKDDALAGQTDKDLAETPPLKANASINYEYATNSTATIAVVAADRWDKIDSDNGEQAIAGYGIVNMKVNYEFTKNFDLTIGMDNAFDKTYAITNTYKDLTLIYDTTTNDDVMLMNEPGRYYYANLRIKF
ncbi:MAG: TonB-dependent receptor [Campylobacterota bacterium]|nr:TonB-dependent receptor [Campylobacterota bacterium]